MPRQKPLRRFEPRYGVSASMIEAESKWLAREVDDHDLLSATDIETKCVERHVACERSWQHLCMILGDLSERERRTIQCLLFRDFHHILELYHCHVRSIHQAPAPSAQPVTPQMHSPGPFSEWLFNP